MARRFPGDRLVVATHNAGKLAEIERLLAPHGVAVTSSGALGLPEPEETEETFAGNAAIKARAAADATGLPALADDSGLAVAALGGAPGVRTAEWATTADGTRDFAMGMEKVRAACERAGAPEPWAASFVSVLCLAWPEGGEETFEGRVSGTLVWPPRGAGGFGYDPMFVPEGASRTFGEMTAEEKQAVSHRARALAGLAGALFEE